MILYRAVSRAENIDIEKTGQFRTTKNTLEGKQFFKSITAIEYFVSRANLMNYRPPYTFVIAVQIDEHCFNALQFDDQILDGYDAITIVENNLEYLIIVLILK